MTSPKRQEYLLVESPQSAGLTITATVSTDMHFCAFGVLRWPKTSYRRPSAQPFYGSFQQKSSERSWLCGILKNKICDYFRMLGRETCFTDLEFLDDEMSPKFIDQGGITI
jgi:hypothetical protein